MFVFQDEKKEINIKGMNRWKCHLFCFTFSAESVQLYTISLWSYPAPLHLNSSPHPGLEKRALTATPQPGWWGVGVVSVCSVLPSTHSLPSNYPVGPPVLKHGRKNKNNNKKNFTGFKKKKGPKIQPRGSPCWGRHICHVYWKGLMPEVGNKPSFISNCRNTLSKQIRFNLFQSGTPHFNKFSYSCQSQPFLLFAHRRIDFFDMKYYVTGLYWKSENDV